MRLAHGQFQLGTLYFDSEANQLTYADQCLQIEPKLVEVISFLAIHRNQVVTREELMAAVWREQVVSDNALNRSISQIRKLFELADDPAPLIETIPKVGYRLVVEKQEQAASSPVVQKLGKKNSLKERFQSISALIKVLSFVLFTLIVVGQYLYQSFFVMPSGETGKVSRLTTMPGIEQIPKFSPDGKSVVFSHSPKGGDDNSLYLMDLKSRQTTLLLEDSPLILDIAWSPDSKKMIVSRWDNRFRRNCSIELIELTDSQQLASFENILQCGQRALVTMAWHRSGNKLYFTDRQSIDRPYSVFSYSLLSQRKQQLTLPRQDGNLKGDFFISGNTNGTRLAVLTYEATQKTRLTLFDLISESRMDDLLLNERIHYVSWFGEQDKLLIKSQGKLFELNPDDGKRQFVYAVGKTAQDFSIDSSEQQIVYATGESDSNIYEFDLEGQQEKTPLTQSTSHEVVPSFANQHPWLAYFSEASGTLQIWIRDEFGNHRQISDSPVSLGISPLIWSPDDTKILFQFRDEIFTLNVSSRKIDRLIDVNHKPYVASWSFNGDAIFYSSEKTGEWQIWRYDPLSRVHQQITWKGGYSAFENAQGELYYSKLHTPGIWKIRRESGKWTTPQKVFADFDVSNWGSWSLRDEGIYFIKTEEDRGAVYFYQFKENSAHLVWPLKEKALRYFSIKEGKIAVSVVENTESRIELLQLNQAK